MHSIAVSRPFHALSRKADSECYRDLLPTTESEESLQYNHHVMAASCVQLKALLVLGLICVAAPSRGGELNEASTPTPVWSADVVQDLSDVGRNPPKLAFLDNGHLIVSQVTLDPSQLSSRKSVDTSSSFRLRLSVLDTSSGKIISTKEWGTRHLDTSVHVTSGGIVIRTGDLLRLCSKDFGEMATTPLSSDPNQGLEIRTSTTGKTVLLNTYHLNRTERVEFSRIDVLDGETLKPRITWVESPGIIDKFAITDKMIAAERCENGRRMVVAEAFGSGMWNPLFELGGGACSPARSGVFATESLLVCGSQEFVMSSTNGDILMIDSFAKRNGSNTQMAAAQDGGYVAVLLEEVRDLWDTGGRITSMRALVYDLSAKKRVMTVSISPPPKHDYDVALSPDGSKLAILNDHKVILYPSRTP